MAYGQTKGRKPFEKASKIAHTHILSNPEVQQFIDSCVLPEPPAKDYIDSLQKPLPKSPKRIEHVIAVDGGMTEVSIRKEFPSASMAFMSFGPLTLSLADLGELDTMPFLAPEDMARLKNLQRYSLSIPTRTIFPKDAGNFCAGVRRTIHQFLASSERPELLEALQWLLFRGWLPPKQRHDWVVPRCPNLTCPGQGAKFESNGPVEVKCGTCGTAVYLADALRLYERIDDEQGAGGIMSYLLTTLEQLVIVHVIRTLLDFKPSVLREILLIKDGPLAFFGVVAPLRKPMQELMAFLAGMDDGNPLVCLVGLEKSGAFVEHATLIEPSLRLGHYLLLNNDYIYKYVQPGDPHGQPFGSNTYYGAKLIYKSDRGDVFVATIPIEKPMSAPEFSDLLNAAEILDVVGKLRCSMYDNAILPIVLANRLVSLADVPSSEILKRFVKSSVSAS